MIPMALGTMARAALMVVPSLVLAATLQLASPGRAEAAPSTPAISRELAAEGRAGTLAAEASARTAASPASDSARSWQDEIIYFIMIDRFQNGDKSNDLDIEEYSQKGYHGGDLQGIIDKLDYIKGIGATAIWITPVVENQVGGYHGYWATDFYKVDRHWGDLTKLKELVDQAHSRGIKVILDIVLNHVAPTHPWTSDPAKESWFHKDGGIKNWNDQEEIENGSLAGLPDLAQENPEVANYLIEMSRWWIDQTGIDGFRLDTARHVPRWFWERFSREIKAAYPGFFLLGEVWNPDPKYLAKYQQAGLDSVTDFSTYYAIRDVFALGADPAALAGLWQAQDAVLPNPSLMATFLDNHDVPRFATEAVPGGRDKLKMALAYVLTSRGIPVIYYGTEVGMEGGGDPDNRRDMRWGQDPELLAYFKELTALRSAHPALRRGSLERVGYDPQVLTYLRRYGDDRVLVVLNNDMKAREVALKLPEGEARTWHVLAGGDSRVRASGGQIVVKVGPKEARILAPARSAWVPWSAAAAAAVVLIIAGVLAVRLIRSRPRA